MLEPDDAAWGQNDSFRRTGCRESERALGALVQSPSGSGASPGSSKGNGRMLQPASPSVNNTDHSRGQDKPSESCASLEDVNLRDVFSEAKRGYLEEGEEGDAKEAGQENAEPVNTDAEIASREDECTVQAKNEQAPPAGLKNAAQRIMTMINFSKIAHNSSGKGSCMPGSFRGAVSKCRLTRF